MRAWMLWQQTDERRARSMLGVEVSMVQWFDPRVGPFERRDLIVDVIHFVARTSSDAWHGSVQWSATGVDLSPMSLHALSLGGGLFLDARAGLATGAIAARTSGESPRTARDQAALTVLTVGGEVALYGGDERTEAGLHFVRGILPTLDLTLARDDRLTAWFQHHVGDVQLGASMFVASTRFWDREASSTWALTGGSEAHVLWSLGGGLSLRWSTEVARSFYARLDGEDLSPHPEWALRSFGMVSWSR